MSRAGALIREDVDVIALLQSLAPSRGMIWTEARSVAERQATRLLELNHVDESPVPQFVISSLPGIVVDRRDVWPTSGMTVRARTHWQIVIRASEPRVRQRFTLAHEFKHVLDDCGHEPNDSAHDRCERLCNYFAACLLMPRAWIKHDWGTGTQDVSALSRRYFVSSEAMATRLGELGLSSSTSTPDARPVQHAEAA